MKKFQILFKDIGKNHDENRKFVFNAKSLVKGLTVAEAGLNNSAYIFVI